MKIRLDFNLVKFLNGRKDKWSVMREVVWVYLCSRCSLMKTVPPMIHQDELWHPNLRLEFETGINKLLLDLFNLDPAPDTEPDRMADDGCPHDPDKTIEMDILPYAPGPNAGCTGLINLPQRTVYKRGE